MTYCGYFCDVQRKRDTETKDNLLTAGQNGLNIMRRNLDRDTETKDNLLTAGQNGLNIMRRNLYKIVIKSTARSVTTGSTLIMFFEPPLSTREV